MLPAARAALWDSTLVATLDSARANRALTLRLQSIYGRTAADDRRDALAALQPQRQGFLGLSPKYADLTIDGSATLELRTDRTRNERCTAAALVDLSSGCRGGFTAPRLDNQFNILSGGVIGQRLHINIDYSSERDFTGRNDIQVYYQGLEDEIVRRVEVGTVTFRPPASRFITAAIPANNFGVNASFEVGPLQIQTIAAQQKGSSVANRTFTIGSEVTQPQDRLVRDLDFEVGRFFWVIDPSVVPGYPSLDILNLNRSNVPASSRPVQVQVYRYRAATSGSTINPNIGGINAVARREDSNQQQVAQWELLIQGTDYFLDASALWFVLSSRLDRNDYLAVSYITAAGDTVGTYPLVANQAVSDTLELIVEARQTPDKPTFRYEMRQIYRVAGADLDRNSLDVDLTVNQTKTPVSGQGTYLSLLGLAIPTDDNIFDVQNRLFPRIQDPGAEQVVRESYIVFPSLQPFASPQLAPQERSDSLYRTPEFLLLSEGPTAKFLLRLQYNAASTGDRSNLDLNALQIREGSEQITAGGRVLERGIDYSIDYDIGRVTFLNPDQLFGAGSTQVQARFEERGVFAIAPTTILGASTRYSLGRTGGVNLIGIYQFESSAYNRPPLGFEPSATLVGGINTDLTFQPNGITRLLDRWTTGGATAPSRLDVKAEFAFTKPDPNRAGAAYLEEFEADAGVPVGLRENQWQFGSRPQSAAGLDVEIPSFAAGFDSSAAVALTWQNFIPDGRGGAVEIRPQDIDTLIRVVGTGTQNETVMYLTLHADTAGGVVQSNNSSRWSLPSLPFTPRWRSMVTSLSSTGLDLSRTEFLEFWVFQPSTRSADSAGVRLVIDLGGVNEDALAIAPDSFTVSGADTTYTGRAYEGVGKLDSEREPTGIFNAAVDDIGILADRPDTLFEGGQPVIDLPLCARTLSTTVPIFPWGDLSGRCSNGNGVLDTEDLNGDNVLNANGAAENVLRYVVNLADSKYFVRDGVTAMDNQGRIAGWKLYRIPLSSPDATIGAPNRRLIQHLRVTVAAPPDNGAPDVVARFALARLKFLGTPWYRRAAAPIAGLAGATGQPQGEVATTVISTENQELGYEPPPGVVNQVNRKDGGRDVQGTQINEKSLRVLAQGLNAGDRAEAFFRFPAGPQSMLRYRTLSFWVRGRGPGWDSGELEAFLKLGADASNFYLYRQQASTTTWEPEGAIDLEVWRRLRADVESRYLKGQPPNGADCPGSDPNAYVACEGNYLVHILDPGINPPNLASVQEISTGIYRVSGTASPADTAELWVDDIRLEEPVSKVGTALALNTRLTASDVGDLSISYVRQDGFFQQIGTDPSYRTTGALQLSGAWRADRFLPTSWGLQVPVAATYSRDDVNPELLTRTDIRGDQLDGLRKPRSWSATYSFGIRRSARGQSFIMRNLVDPLAFNASLTRGRSQTELSSASSSASTYNLAYLNNLARSGPTLRLGGLVDLLPAFLRNGEFGKGLRANKVSLVPSNIRLTSNLTRNEGDLRSFLVPVERPDDNLRAPIRSLAHLWRNSAGVTWQPVGMMTMSADLSSTRDLRQYADSTPLGRLAGVSRRSLLGADVGVERDRQLATSLSLTPRIASWVRPRFLTTSQFVLSRSLTSRSPVREFGDSAGAFILPQTLNGARSREIGASIDVGLGLARVFGDSSFAARLTRRFRPFDWSNRLSRSSTFDLAAFDPGLGYQLGLGGREEFLKQEGSSALSVNETRTTTFQTGADLPLGVSFTTSYSRINSTRLQLIGNAYLPTLSLQREWPVGTLRFTQSLRNGPLSLVGLGMGFRKRVGSTTQLASAGSNARTATTSSTVTPDLRLGFRNGVVLSVSYNAVNQETENNGNLTQLEQDDITATANYIFRLPSSVSRLRKQVRASLTAVSRTSVNCLQRRDDEGCLTISDTRGRELRGSLNADISKIMTGGLNFGYSLNDARHLNRRISTIFLSITAQIFFYSADYR